MAKKTIKLPLSDEERKLLRQARIKLSDIAGLDAETLSTLTTITIERAKRLAALACFQQIPSIGIRLAEDLVSIGYYSLEELRDQDGARLIEKLENHCGTWIDPCVEDQLRCVVFHANHPGSEKQWWDFTAERKAYRAKHGYPADRPTTPWHEE